MNRKYLDRLFADNNIVELRHEYRYSGLFDDPEKLLAAARERHREGNLFVSLNRFSPRPANNIMGTACPRDSDVQVYTRLFFDLDAIKPQGVSSTDEERDAAIDVAKQIRDVLLRWDWPEPALCTSGNGAHLYYRVHLPNTQEVRSMLDVIYRGIQDDWKNAPAKFDTKVNNPSRIAPLYGSIKRKGPNTAERPHRQSKVLELPDPWRVVSRENLERVAGFIISRDAERAKNTLKPPVRRSGRVSGSGRYDTIDVVAWFTSHGLYRRPLGGDKHAVVCPWEEEHSTESFEEDTSTVIFENPGRWPGFHCSHAHCEHRTINDVMALLGDADNFCSERWRDEG